MAMRIAFVECGDEEVKVNVAASGKGRLNVVASVVLDRCMLAAV
jgi:hypothetical protein